MFSALEAAKRFLRPHVEAGTLSESFALAMAGGFAGAVVSLVSTPPQVLKVRMQTQVLAAAAAGTGAAPQPRGGEVRATVAALVDLLRKRGPLGLYTAYRAQLLCESIGRMTYYLTYETTKAALVRLRTKTGAPKRRALDPVSGVTLPERMVAGACAGCVGWTVTFPFDVARNRLVSQGDSKTPRYRGVLHCLVTSMREEGPRVLFRGLGVTLLRAGPVAMTVLPTFDLVREFLAAHLEEP